MNFTRRQFLTYAGAAGIGALAVDGLIIEPGMVEFTHHELGARSPASPTPLRFAQLSDLHLSSVGAMHREIATTLGGLDLDFLIITGDAIDGNHYLQDLDDLLALFAADLPKYAILGNWEHWGHVSIGTLGELYAARNGNLLVNATEEIRHGDKRMLITGIDDYIAGMPSIEHALRDIPPAAHHLILAHCPMHRDYLADYTMIVTRDTSRVNPAIDFDSYRARYLFAGHTHGGQVNIAGVRPFMPKGSGSYVQGWYRDRMPHMYVSRGVGTSILPVRIGAHPEVAIFTMWI